MKNYFLISEHNLITNKTYSLLLTTYECLLLGVKKAHPGNFLSDIGHEIQKYAENKNYSVTEFTEPYPIWVIDNFLN